MNTRQTSIDCFNQIKQSGSLSKSRFQVYETLFKLNKPSTAREIFAKIPVVKIEPTRLTELRDMGAIYEKGVRKCQITGVNSIEWDLTDKQPKKLPARITAKQKLKNLEIMIDNLDNKVKDLLVKSELNDIKNYLKENFKTLK
jgi:hypothetical protein